MRPFLMALIIFISAPLHLKAQGGLGSPVTISLGFTTDDPTLALYVRGKARYDTRNMYLRSVNEREERAACLYGCVVEIGPIRSVIVTEIVEIEASYADSGRFLPAFYPTCNPEGLVGRLHTHIVTLGPSRVAFSPDDDEGFTSEPFLVDLIIWNVDKDFMHFTLRTMLGENLYRTVSIKNCCNVKRR